MKSSIPLYLTQSIKNLYTPNGYCISQPPVLEIESENYGACRFSINNKNIVYRVAKTTIDRPGQFVTIWKRPDNLGDITPLDSTDSIDFLIIHTFAVGLDGKKYMGQYIFPKNFLISKHIISHDGKPGKLAMRIFPPWSDIVANDKINSLDSKDIVVKTAVLSDSARKTQIWQQKYFLPLNEDCSTNAPSILNMLFA